MATLNPELTLSINGLNHRDQRLANGGNQFSLEPPDQALCVGNGFVVEAVNSVLRVFSSATGAALTGVQDLNTFFGYPAAINRTTGVVGPNVIDPVCHYDPDNNRFMVVITTLHVDANGDFNGKNTIDLAVSNTRRSDGRVDRSTTCPAQNDGTDGTPEPRLHARRHAARTVLPGLPAHRCRPERRLRHDQRVRPVRARATTPRRSSPSPRRSWPRTRPSIDVTLVENLERRRIARVHRVAGHLTSRPVLERSATAPSTC